MLIENQTQFAEVQFFFRLALSTNASQQTFALVSIYGRPDRDLLLSSHGTVWSCLYKGATSFAVIDVTTITSVIAMLPHPVVDTSVPENRAGYLFVVEKLGLDGTMLDSIDDGIALHSM